ncbi:MAG: hypothetical protein N3A66_04815, partial [Planctomycetota bacterium]|nr:hypothetical protein [Planctomycetota bacterium]
IPVLIIGVYACYLYLLGQPLSERLTYFWQQRSLGSALSASSRPLNLVDYLSRVPGYFANHLTPLPLMLAAGWLIAWFKGARRGERQREAWLVGALAAFACLVYATALRSSFEHRCYTLWWLPFLAVSGGSFLQRLGRSLAPRRQRVLLFAVFLALASSSVYKIYRQEQKSAKAAGRIAFFQECSAVIPRDEAVAIGSLGAFSEAVTPAAHQPGCKEFRVRDAKHPALFYLWRKTSPLLLCRCGPPVANGPSYAILPQAEAEKIPSAVLLRQRDGLALIRLTF